MTSGTHSGADWTIVVEGRYSGADWTIVVAGRFRRISARHLCMSHTLTDVVCTLRNRHCGFGIAPCTEIALSRNFWCTSNKVYGKNLVVTGQVWVRHTWDRGK